MRDDLVHMIPRNNEMGIVNLDSSSGMGTHWVAYHKNGNKVFYYDSFGDLPPPKEVEKYLSGNSIYFNYNTEQKLNTSICGHLCLQFLLNQTILPKV